MRMRKRMMMMMMVVVICIMRRLRASKQRRTHGAIGPDQVLEGVLSSPIHHFRYPAVRWWHWRVWFESSEHNFHYTHYSPHGCKFIARYSNMAKLNIHQSTIEFHDFPRKKKHTFPSRISHLWHPEKGSLCHPGRPRTPPGRGRYHSDPPAAWPSVQLLRNIRPHRSPRRKDYPGSRKCAPKCQV